MSREYTSGTRLLAPRARSKRLREQGIGGTVIMPATQSGSITIHSQLSGRDAADSHPMSAISGLSDKFNDYLPLTGGTMTGDIHMNANNVDGLTKASFKNGSSSEIWLSTFAGRLGVATLSGSTPIAAPLSTGSMLVSNDYGSGSLVPKNGIFCRGDAYFYGNIGIGTPADNSAKLNIAGGDIHTSGKILITAVSGSVIEARKGSKKVFLLGSGSSATTEDTEFGYLGLFHTNNEERIRLYTLGHCYLNPIGNVGIGITEPTEKLDVTGTVKATAMQSDLFGDKTFESGVSGKGMRAWMNNGKSYAEVDNLTVRQSMHVFELTIQQIKYQGGIIIYSAAGMEIVKVEEIKSSGVITAWKCYFDTKSGQRKNEFAVGDFGYCKRWNGESHAPIKYYWRKVIAIGEDYITLSNAAGEYDPTIVGGNNVPEVGDSVVQLGHISDTGRQNAKITTVINVGGDSDVPADRYYSGINPPTQSWVLPSPVTTVGRKNGKMGVYTDEGVFTGTVNAKQGLFSGTVEMGATSDTVNAGLNGTNETTYIKDNIRIWAGKSTSEKANAPFKVYHDGRLYASNAEIEGSIIIKGGLIATVLGVGPDTSHINAGMSGEESGTDSIRFWAGKAAADKASAPFRVQHDGKIYASNAEISGSSLIGGFYLKDGGLTNESTSKDAYITISKTGGYAFAAMGTNVHPSGSIYYGPGRFEVSRTYSLGGSANVALKLSATGATHYDQTSLCGSHALVIESGYTTGLNPHIRRVNSSATILETDTIIAVTQTGITITFPYWSNQKYDGKWVVVKNYKQGDITLKAATGCNLHHKEDVSQILVSYAEMVMLFYDATNKLWIMNIITGWGGN